jgi:hypothetical protein
MDVAQRYASASTLANALQHPPSPSASVAEPGPAPAQQRSAMHPDGHDGGGAEEEDEDEEMIEEELVDHPPSPTQQPMYVPAVLTSILCAYFFV